MKQKLFMLLAAMLLGSVSVFAQSGNNEPLKGDVNGDGTVDVADITAVIKIMKDGGGTGEQTKYYWYVGQIMPSDPNNSDQNTGANKWTQLLSTPNQLVIESPQPSVGTWYVAIPNEYGFQVYDTTGTSPDTAGYNKSQININSISYDLFTSSNQMLRVMAVFKP